MTVLLVIAGGVAFIILSIAWLIATAIGIL